MQNTALSEPHNVFIAAKDTSMSGWRDAYLSLVVKGSSPATLEAKQRDLRLFMEFATLVGVDNRVQLWTPSVSKAFQNEMLERYSSATVVRTMATVGHFARWLKENIKFIAGDPMSAVRKIKLEEAAWNGLSKKELFQLRSAIDIRLAACKRKDQNPLLEAAVFYLLLYTGLRESELVNLNFGQYNGGTTLLNVKRKGQRISGKVPVPKEASIYLDHYLREESRDTDEPLFKTRGGNRLNRKDVARICTRISALTPDRVKLTPHMLRHTFLKKVTDKHGVHIAQKLSGNISVREIFRYAKPSYEESAFLVENLF